MSWRRVGEPTVVVVAPSSSAASTTSVMWAAAVPSSSMDMFPLSRVAMSAVLALGKNGRSDFRTSPALS